MGEDALLSCLLVTEFSAGELFPPSGVSKQKHPVWLWDPPPEWTHGVRQPLPVHLLQRGHLEHARWPWQQPRPHAALRQPRAPRHAAVLGRLQGAQPPNPLRTEAAAGRSQTPQSPFPQHPLRQRRGGSCREWGWGQVTSNRIQDFSLQLQWDLGVLHSGQWWSTPLEIQSSHGGNGREGAWVLQNFLVSSVSHPRGNKTWVGWLDPSQRPGWLHPKGRIWLWTSWLRRPRSSWIVLNPASYFHCSWMSNAGGARLSGEEGMHIGLM